MKKMLKITGIVIGVLVLAAAGLLLAAKLLITPERVRTTVVPIAEKHLNREVSIGDIEIRLFSGISIRDFRVMEKEGEKSFISARSLQLSYRLLPLLKKQVVIDQVRLKEPDILVVRNRDGTFNFSDIMDAGGGNESSAAGSFLRAPVFHAASANQGPAIDLTVSKADITGGRINFTDHSAGKDPFSSEITDLEASARDISMKDSFPFQASGRLNTGGKFSFSGTADPEAQSFNGDVKLSGLEASEFRSYYGDSFPGNLESASLGLDLKVKAEPRELTSEGMITAEGVAIELDSMPGAGFKNARFSVDHDISVLPETGIIEIRKADVNANDIAAEATGTVSDFDSDPRLDISVSLPETKAPVIMAALPEKMAEQAGSMADFSGSVSAELRLAGKAAAPERLLESGRISLKKLGGKAEGVEFGATGDIDLSSDLISSENLEIDLGEDRVFIDFEVTEFFSPPVRITHTAEAETLNLDYLLAAAESISPAGRNGAATGSDQSGDRQKDGGKDDKTDVSSSAPVDLPLFVSGRIRAKEARLRNLSARDLETVYTLEDNIFTVESFSAAIAEGNASGSARADLGKQDLEYSAEISLGSIAPDELIKELYPAASGIVSGKADLDGTFSGTGLSPEKLRETLTGRADYKISDGRFSGGEITGQLSSLFGISDLKTLDFDTFSGDLKIDSGRIEMESSYDSSDVRMNPTGTIGLDGDLDIALNLRLAPHLSDKVSSDSFAGRLLADSEGWTRIPVSVSGSVVSPGLALDRSGLKKQLKEEGTRRVIEEGLNRLFD